MLTFGIYAQLYHLCKANFAGIVLSYRYEFEVTVASAGGFSVFSFMTVLHTTKLLTTIYCIARPNKHIPEPRAELLIGLVSR